MKRVSLFILANLAILVMLSVSVRVLGLDRHLTAAGLDLASLLVFCAVFGFGGAFLALLVSKPMARWSVGARVIDTPRTLDEVWLVKTVGELAGRAGIDMPEVAVYRGEPNAFATGASRNRALVAVSTGLLQALPRDEVRAVLAHEVAHVANGDMVTMALLQGVLNTFVMFVARVACFVIDRIVLKNDGQAPGIGYLFTVVVLELVLGGLAALVVAAYSRRREYRADWDAATLLDSAVPMQRALARLQGRASDMPKDVAALGIHGAGGLFALFASHPPLSARIRALASFGR